MFQKYKQICQRVSEAKLNHSLLNGSIHSKMLLTHLFQATKIWQSCYFCKVLNWQPWKHNRHIFTQLCRNLYATTCSVTHIWHSGPSLQTASGLLLSPSPLLSGLHLWNSLSPVGPLSPGHLQGHAPLFQVNVPPSLPFKDMITFFLQCLVSLFMWCSVYGNPFFQVNVSLSLPFKDMITFSSVSCFSVHVKLCVWQSFFFFFFYVPIIMRPFFSLGDSIWHVLLFRSDFDTTLMSFNV